MKEVVCPLYSKMEGNGSCGQGGGRVCSASDFHAEDWSLCPIRDLQLAFTSLLT